MCPVQEGSSEYFELPEFAVRRFAGDAAKIRPRHAFAGPDGSAPRRGTLYCDLPDLRCTLDEICGTTSLCIVDFTAVFDSLGEFGIEAVKLVDVAGGATFPPLATARVERVTVGRPKHGYDDLDPVVDYIGGMARREHRARDQAPLGLLAHSAVYAPLVEEAVEHGRSVILIGLVGAFEKALYVTSDSAQVTLWDIRYDAHALSPLVEA